MNSILLVAKRLSPATADAAHASCRQEYVTLSPEANQAATENDKRDACAAAADV